MNIVITEYFLSTYNPEKNGLSLLSEAFEMVSALINTLENSGIEVFLTISRHLAHIMKHSNIIVIDCEDKYLDILENLKSLTSYFIVIAPPDKLIVIADVVREKLLGPSLNIIKILSNKYLTALLARQCGINTPKTIACENSDKCNLDNLAFPLIIKPSMSAGAENVYLAKNLDEAKKYIDIVAYNDIARYAVVQEYIDGIHGSISAVFDLGKPVFSSLNLQLISVSYNKIMYFGNILPLRSNLYRSWAEEILNRISLCVEDLRGYIGIDVVWNHDNMYIVEINPRFTTSGIGIVDLYPDFGKILINRSSAKHIYLGDIVQGYAYIVKKTMDYSQSKKNIDYYLYGLRHGYVNSFKDAIGNVKNINLEAIQNLVYDILSIE